MMDLDLYADMSGFLPEKYFVNRIVLPKRIRAQVSFVDYIRFEYLIDLRPRTVYYSSWAGQYKLGDRNVAIETDGWNYFSQLSTNQFLSCEMHNLTVYIRKLGVLGLPKITWITTTVPMEKGADISELGNSFLEDVLSIVKNIGKKELDKYNSFCNVIKTFCTSSRATTRVAL